MNERQDQLGRIGVLMGGYSSERAISLKSGKAIYDAFKKGGYNVVPLDITDRERNKILSLILDAKIDVAFIALHGCLGEDGAIQSILEEADIVYTGSGIAASRLVINKILTQNLLKKNNISVPSYVTLSRSDGRPIERIVEQLNVYPLVVKPASEGSSIGISIVQREEELKTALETAWQYDQELLIDKYIQGRELTVGIVGNKTLPVLEICPKRKFFDYEAKYHKGMTEYIVPAQIPDDVAQSLQSSAMKAHNLLGCAGFSRVDFMLGEDMSPYMLELNTIPGFTATSLLPKAAAAIGLTFEKLCITIIELAYAEKKKNKNVPISH